MTITALWIPTPLTAAELGERMERLRPAVFFSHELCARYFTYMGRDGSAHFVLFDDGETLRRKVEVAHRAGIHTFLAPWAQVEEHAGQLGLRRREAAPNTLHTCRTEKSPEMLKKNH